MAELLVPMDPIPISNLYDVEFSDGQVTEHAVKVIAENMLSQVDTEGYGTSLILGILVFKKR